LLRHYLAHEISSLHKNGVRLHIIGNRARLASDIRQKIEEAEQLTSGNTAFTLTVALSYGAREEITRAAKALVEQAAAGKISAEQVNESSISKLLDTHFLPDPDLLIRTGGEQRMSNFLLWQSAYTELFFT